MPTDVALIRREHVEAFIEWLLEKSKPATANNRYRGLRRFFGWLVEEGEIKEFPMGRMKPPKTPENPPPVLTEAQLRAVLNTCAKGKDFESRRERVLAIGHKVELALDLHLRARDRHPSASDPWLWLGIKGRLADSGIRQVFERRGKQAGLSSLHPHTQRHSFAHQCLVNGGNEGNLMRLTGGPGQCCNVMPPLPPANERWWSTGNCHQRPDLIYSGYDRKAYFARLALNRVKAAWKKIGGSIG